MAGPSLTLTLLSSMLTHQALSLPQHSRSSSLTILQKNIFSGYSPSIQPSMAGNPGDPPLSVELGLAPQWMELQDTGVLSITGWLRLQWPDPRLAWEPSEHEDIAAFRTQSARVWRPDVILLNKQDLAYGNQAVDPRAANTSSLQVDSNGNVTWILPISHKVLCEKITYYDWPWGKQTCNLKFGTYSQDYNGYDLQFYSGKNKMNLRQFGKYNQFKIVRQRAVRKLTKSKHSATSQFISLNFVFSLQRRYMVDPEKGRIDNPSPPEPELEDMLRKLG